MSIRGKKIAALAIVLLSSPLILSEILVRSLGFVDFPIYTTDDQIGYIIKQNQHGVFLTTNDWYFNNESMPIKKVYEPNIHPNMLLIGNSIIMGGNAYKQQDKLTTVIQQRLGQTPAVWPIAIGGWTQINEMVYLDRHPDIVKAADYVAWEYMNGGLSSANPWSSEYTFPTHRPWYATWYFIRRYLISRLPSFGQSELPVVGEASAENIQAFDTHLGSFAHANAKLHKGFIWLYPTSEQLTEARRSKEWLPERAQIERIAAKYGFRTIDLASYPEWNETLYRDGVHPTTEGNTILADILLREIRKDSSDSVMQKASSRP